MTVQSLALFRTTVSVSTHLHTHAVSRSFLCAFPAPATGFEVVLKLQVVRYSGGDQAGGRSVDWGLQCLLLPSCTYMYFIPTARLDFRTVCDARESRPSLLLPIGLSVPQSWRSGGPMVMLRPAIQECY
ncbi:hypothetical protein OH76DRAFT_1408105 [Lentinus brumalis]|uniref:Uncharacterized protein n=1 Tax=Lentinus brumalis TaxID=2498619 RepID=A0A371CYH0_9APHY|nr:hypothetical protein OH76DRAFT_1408105 [Polyporus brumalis]